jgi:hypothetical protein
MSRWLHPRPRPRALFAGVTLAVLSVALASTVSMAYPRFAAAAPELGASSSKGAPAAASLATWSGPILATSRRGTPGTAIPAHRPKVASQSTQDEIALGVYTQDSPEPLEVHAFQQLVGRSPSIVMWYQSWSEPLFYSSQISMVAQDGATPLITWDPELTGGVGVPLSQIVAGDYDTYIQAQAEAAASWHRTIYVRFGQEMNLSGSPFGPGVNGNTPQLFIEAWRHVVRIFRTAGATNVKWVWSPNVDCAGKCPFKAFYPGDSWVDWVGLDGYNYAAVDDVPWMSFETIFQSSYNQLSALTSKPIMIAETASTTLGGNKAAWITKALTQTLPTEMPLVRALVWFDVDKETNWTVNSSPASLNAFRAAVDQPLFSGTLAG